MKVRILIADDEPLLRADLAGQLRQLWPEAELIAAEDGYAALHLVREHAPDIAFLDIRMPGLSGLEIAAAFSARIHVVFVTAYSEHAVEAFEQGAVDYVLKPVDPARLARTLERVRERLSLPPRELGRLMQQLERPQAPPSWIQASVGQTVHFIELADVVYFTAEDKYTRVVTDTLEAHIRTPLKELAESLENAGFWQVHRGHVVSVKRIATAVRDEDGAMWLTLRRHDARLPVSQRFQYRFRGM